MFTLKEIAEVCNGKLIPATHSSEVVNGISCDSRTVQPGDLFIALKGERFDGHLFLNDVFQKGVRCALIHEPVETFQPTVLVKDTLKAMQQLSRTFRRRFQIPAVAITGSAGKTTTKECIGAVLSKFWKTRTGFANWNNHIGVPLNLFKLTREDQCLVLELGANHLHEIKTLSEIMEPTIGVITGIYPVHLEGFGSLENIYKAKLELADFLDGHSGVVIANGDDPELVKRLINRRFKLITFGTSAACDYRMSELMATQGTISFKVNDRFLFQLKGYGSFNAMNVLAAVAVAGHFNVDLNLVSRTWNEMPKIDSRFRLDYVKEQDIQLIDDSYNANPKSFETALESFKELSKGRRKIILIGDMLELGQEAEHYHRQLGRQIAKLDDVLLMAVGPLSRHAIDEYNALRSRSETMHFNKSEDAAQCLVSQIKPGDSIFIKGSHGTGLYQVKKQIEEFFKTSHAST